MRIIGGELKGRTLCPFDGEAIRPTADKVRESLFDILRNRISGARFLDLYCGTGAMGIEAYSRGAAEVLLNDAARSSLSVVEKNLTKCSIKGNPKIKTNCADAINFLKRSAVKYDIIYIDPPYKLGLLKSSVLAAENVLNCGGVIIAEDEKPFDGLDELPFGDVKSDLIISDRRKYGRAYLTFFVKKIATGDNNI